MSHSASAVAGFIDIATYDEIESYLYSFQGAVTYFVRATMKSTWFTQIPVKLTASSGQTEFGKEFSYHVSRSGDYLLNTWLRVKLNKAVLSDKSNGAANYKSDGNGGFNDERDFSARYTTNLMHNLVKKIEIKFNDLSAHEVKSHHMDFYRNFSLRRSKRAGYNMMIGNRPEVAQWASASTNSNDLNTLGDVYLNLPLPLFYEGDSGSALPTAALPYNDMRIHFELNKWEDLVVVDKFGLTKERNDSNGNSLVLADQTAENNARVETGDKAKYFSVAPKLEVVELWANYAIVSKEERERMGRNPRNIVIEQVQHAPVESFQLAEGGQKHYDLRFSHAVKAIFFGVKNLDMHGERSNYTQEAHPNPAEVAAKELYVPDKNIIRSASLIYENTTRLGSMGVDYFTLVNPYYHAESDGTDQPGVCLYSYALDLMNHDPMGSTNFGKLTNVTLTPVSDEDRTAKQSEFLVTVINHNVIRIAGGALGFPVL